MARTFEQTTIVDMSEYGQIDKAVLDSEIKKFNHLSSASQEQLKKGLENAEIWHWKFREIMEGKRSFTPNEFRQFRMAIEYYQDLENEARRNKAARIDANRTRKNKSIFSTA